MKDFTIYESSDYAGMEVSSKKIKFYYGYESTDTEGNNCFDASFPGGGVRIPFPKLKMENNSLDQWECIPCLMTGIALLIRGGYLKTSPVSVPNESTTVNP